METGAGRKTCDRPMLHFDQNGIEFPLPEAPVDEPHRPEAHWRKGHEEVEDDQQVAAIQPT